MRGLIRWVLVARQKSVHYGQVVPIEDVEKILDMSTSVFRLACMCRSASSAAPRSRPHRKPDPATLDLVRLGSHSELFG